MNITLKKWCQAILLDTTFYLDKCITTLCLSQDKSLTLHNNLILWL